LIHLKKGGKMLGNRLISWITAVAAALLVVSCTSALRQKRELYESKQPREQWTESKDSTGEYFRQGKYVSWHENGREKITGEYHRGQKTSTWTTKDERGRLVEWCEYENGDLHGLFVSYYPDKIKRQEGKYVRGQREGVWRQWYDDGSLKEDGAYINGRQHYVWTSWYRGGQKQEECEYKNGRLDGPYLTWRESGLRWVEGQYKNGLKVGTWTTWDDLGVVFSQEQYADGKLVPGTPSALSN